MSNSDKRDHSRYNEFANDEKPSSFGSNRQIGNKKGMYKYKDGTNINEKSMNPEHIDAPYRKNINKKYSNYGNNQYSNDNWCNEKEKFSHNTEDSNNPFKNKQKKRQKEDYYLNSNHGNYENREETYLSKNTKNQEDNADYDSNTQPYSSMNEHNNTNSMDLSYNQKQNSHTHNFGYNTNSFNNNYIPGKFNRRKNNLSSNNNQMSNNVVNQSYTQTNFYNKNKNNENFNPYVSNPYQVGVNNSIGNNTNPLQSNPNLHQNNYLQRQNEKFTSRKNSGRNVNIKQMNEGGRNTNLIGDEEFSNSINENILTQQNDILNNNKLVKNILPNNKPNMQQTEENSNSAIHTPRRNSLNSLPTVINTNNVTYNSSNFTPGNSVSFSPATEQLYMNRIQMQNINFNSPMKHMNESFMFNNMNNVRGLNSTHMNQPYFGTMSGMNPIMKTMDQNNYQLIQGNINNNYSPNLNNQQNNPNFPFFYNNKMNFNVMNQMKNPMGNMNQMNMNVNLMNNIKNQNQNFGNFNNIDETGNMDSRSNFSHQRFPHSNNNQFQMIPNYPGNNYINHPINPNPLDNQNQISNNMNIFMEQKKNNYGSSNQNGKVLKNTNHNKKIALGNFNKMKFTHSERDLVRSLQTQNLYNPSNQKNINENLDKMKMINQFNGNNSNNKRTQFTNENVPINNKMEQNNPNNQNTAFHIRDSIKRNSQKSSFGSIKEEFYKKNNFIEDKNSSDDNSEYSTPGEEIQIDNQNNEVADNNFILCVSVKLLEKEETILISKNEDIMSKAGEFVFKHQLNKNLIKPIFDKITLALNSLNMIMDYKVSSEDHSSLSNIKNYYKDKFENEDSTQLELSCITDIGSQGYNINDSLSLSPEEARKFERLNASR